MHSHPILAVTLACLLAWPPPSSGRTDNHQAAHEPTATLTLLHSNDTHSRIEPFTDRIPQGGAARRKTLIEQVRGEVGVDNILLLDAGDFFQGTPFFHAWGGSESIMVMNDMRYDAATLGNHEFDLGVAGLARALTGGEIAIAGVSHATEVPTFPIIATNLDFSGEPAMHGLTHPYRVIEKAGNRYGVLGVVTEHLPTISNLGANIRVLDYVDSVNAATATLHAQGVDKIILLSHSGYAVDRTKVPALSGVDIIVSGHDHALLGEATRIDAASADVGLGYTGQGGLSIGPYPSEMRDRDGNPVLLVSAYEWGRWLGRLDVRFDRAGHVLSGLDQSIFVDGRKVAEDAALAAKIATWKVPIDAYTRAVIGASAMAFSRDPGAVAPYRPGLRTGETALGNLIADLMEGAARGSDDAVAAVTNGGGLRADLAPGAVTYGQALSVLPFGNTLVVVDLTGQEVIELLEAGIAKQGGGGFLQLSKNLHLRYCAEAEICDSPLQAGGRVTAVEIAGQPVEIGKIYRLAGNSFTARGGDGHAVLKRACARPGNHCRDTGINLLDLLVNELKRGKPLASEVEGRITRQRTKPLAP